MKNNKEYLELKFRTYTDFEIDKRINYLIITGFLLLLFLIYSDIIIRHSTEAIYTRLVPLILSLCILILKNIKKGIRKHCISVLYSVFLFSIIAMMYAKFLIHLDTDNEDLNIISIITAIFIVSLELRTNLLISLLIFFGSFILFIIVLFTFFSYNSETLIPLINVLIILIVGFIINRIQNKLRYENFIKNHFLKLEEQKMIVNNKKLAEKNKELEKFHELFIEREFRIKELREKIKELEKKLHGK